MRIFASRHLSAPQLSLIRIFHASNLPLNSPQTNSFVLFIERATIEPFPTIFSSVRLLCSPLSPLDLPPRLSSRINIRRRDRKPPRRKQRSRACRERRSTSACTRNDRTAVPPFSAFCDQILRDELPRKVFDRFAAPSIRNTALGPSIHLSSSETQCAILEIN